MRAPRSLRIGAGAAAAVALLAACAGPRNTLNTATSHCFRALPLAKATVNNRGHLVGVRSVVATTLAGRLPEADRLGRQRLCLIAFRGPYAAGEIPRAQPAGPGPYAIVAVDSNGSTVLASFVVDELPLRFRHRL
ncbi:MAG TPA: hypothetical protein VJ456_15385 [Acidimicrobiia bacterium]|nr:hypothetical protein [Acidimicrobiia bacterium]HTC81008.1 hypothetical protein [Acidimicrobiia bacterium]